jgi:hypothetical protein
MTLHLDVSDALTTCMWKLRDELAEMEVAAGGGSANAHAHGIDQEYMRRLAQTGINENHSVSAA